MSNTTRISAVSGRLLMPRWPGQTDGPEVAPNTRARPGAADTVAQMDAGLTFSPTGNAPRWLRD